MTFTVHILFHRNSDHFYVFETAIFHVCTINIDWSFILDDLLLSDDIKCHFVWYLQYSVIEMSITQVVKLFGYLLLQLIGDYPVGQQTNELFSWFNISDTNGKKFVYSCVCICVCACLCLHVYVHMYALKCMRCHKFTNNSDLQ